MSDFDRAFELLLMNEGGYGNNKYDPGGETKYGISKKQYPYVDIENLTEAEAQEIYLRDYWNANRCGEMPWPFAFFLFDSAVNHAPPNPAKWLQRAIGVTPDGIIGPRTIAAAKTCADKPEALSKALMDRLDYYVQQTNYNMFKDGWRKRLFKVAFACNGE